MKNPCIALLCSLLSAGVFADAPKPVEHLNSPQHDANLPFSEAVRVGDLLFLAGQMGFDPKTGKLAPGGMKAEAQQTMNNIKATMEGFGYTMKDIVKCTVMLKDIGLWGEFNQVYVTYFDKPYPARSAFGASGLAEGGAVEVECIAYVGDKSKD
ncbi:Rid family detoxifying hydrolase [Aliiglaciecola sp. CAU 1673]|uniref:RidA family protein n=1 Tax=Aliiglaciecola sp. CAU 1673 TaxID=3032595 RepID=UPI0023D9C66A|nr:Rid family detoxifying hydrolase [Aliiglaciecola sp. CAU 1673]MDF2180285.1 Rid family detoxifying hydrolase [Aliiglaciecola sp. CAU 1673]